MEQAVRTRIEEIMSAILSDKYDCVVKIHFGQSHDDEIREGGAA